MKRTCTRRIEWDSAHRVTLHESKCRTLHGHRYVADITCEAEALDEVGRVVDFGVIKAKVGAWVDKHWDHTAILKATDRALIDLCRDMELSGEAVKPPFVLSEEPTAETMAECLLAVARVLIEQDGLRVVSVRVYETPNCWAEAVAQ